ncbi:hypothetical protein V6N13_123811 [Hibiscus sabdariffa]|uniref:Uncharacterized protein n=1 Tax=Hibiscus sabdariffa TaxID=183260 RepID=A0ABR2QV09_9ROSI
MGDEKSWSGRAKLCAQPRNYYDLRENEPESTTEVEAEVGIVEYPEVLEPQPTIEIFIKAEILNISESHSTIEVVAGAEILQMTEPQLNISIVKEVESPSPIERR